MADVPLYPVDGARPAPLPGPHISGGNAEQFGAEGAREKQAFAGALQDFVNEQSALQNQVRVNDALNQARQKALDLTYGDQGYVGLQGRNALERPDGQALPDEYGAKLKGAISDIQSTLTPQQQRVFGLQAADLQTSFHGDVQRHMLTQSRSYALSVQASTLKLASDTAAQKWDDPRAINGGVDEAGNLVPGLVQQAKAAVYASGKLTGQDVQASMLQAESGIHSRVIQAALENGNPIYAMSYLGAHSKDMTSDDILRVQGRVNQTADAQIATLAVDKVAGDFKGALAPTDTDRLHNLVGLVAHRESGGHETNPDGSTVTSPKGAKGVMQVLDSTAGNPGFGIKPAARLPDGSFDPADRARVGQEYLGAMLRRYGNVPQALAAYNAGPDPVDKAIADTKSVDEPGLWLQALPKETQNYVAAIAPKFDAGAGAAPLPTKEEFVQQAIDSLGPNPRPTALQLTRQHAEQRFGILMSSRAEQGDQALRTAQQALIQNGGDFAALQRDQPDVVANLSRFDPGKYDDALKFAKAIGRGENESDPGLYADMAAHPQDLAKLSDAQFLQLRTRLSDTDFKRFATERGDITSGKTNNTAESIDTGALNSVLKERLTNLGLNPDPKSTDTTNRARIGAVSKYLRDGIYAAQQQAGKKFTPEQVSDFVDQQFSRNAVMPHWWNAIGIGNANKPVLGLTSSDLPSATSSAIRARLVAEGNAAPTEGDVMNRYWAVTNGRR